MNIFSSGFIESCIKFGFLGAASAIIDTCKVKGTFAITYDDGPYIYENQITTNLSKQNAKGTFFVNGLNYGCIYDQDNVDSLRRAFSQGHAIGSHTWSHAKVTELSEKELIKELSLLEVAFKKILGIRTRIFRPPYGELNERAKKVIHDRGYRIITWSVDSGDSVGASPKESIKIYRDSASKFPLPQIALSHETLKPTATQVTPEAIKVLQKYGYRLVTVPECLGWTSYYDRVGKPEARDVSVYLFSTLLRSKIVIL
ncbi:family 4 carbohydrate esterase [Phakopsora pachyrhizi]|nr:family 4 carbohydrate esterase [Phakopsora pachyrhizi]